MPNAKDIPLAGPASFLLVGDSGTHKTFFIGTMPKPIYIFDFDGGMATLAGQSDIDYDTFKEAPKGVAAKPSGGLGQFAYGTAWPAFLLKMNELGKLIDEGKCPYKTIAFDSLTMQCDILTTYILKARNIDAFEQRDWGAYLNNMSNLFNQFTGWPVHRVVTAHIRRNENELTKVVEKLPLISGQMQGKIGAYFDEVYYTEVEQTGAGKDQKLKWTFVTQPNSLIRQAKSRKYNVPNGVETSYEALRPYIERKR